MTATFGFGNYRYELVEEWAELPKQCVASDVAVDSHGKTYVAIREWPYPDVTGGAVLVFDTNGKLLDTWGEDLYATPHGMWIGPNDEIFMTDSADHTVRKYAPSGELLMTIGVKGQTGELGSPFNRPTRAVMSPAGEIFVGDGYGQNRVHRFTAKGELITSWGEDGTGPGQFNLPHDVTIDADNNVYVLDRENDRCQVFDVDGNFLREWPGVPGPNDSVLADDGLLHIATGHQGIHVMSLDGRMVGKWNQRGERPGEFRGYPHGIWIDDAGAVYVAEVGAANALQKFARV
jgi:DNA-binding beta-propeller fold protein YncE